MFGEKIGTIGTIGTIGIDLGRSLYCDTDTVGKVKNEDEKWIWVQGYKATDKTMKCRDYQFNMDKPHVITNNDEIRECHNGFHLCLNLEDCFRYYSPVLSTNRYFKVEALVREKDVKKYNDYIGFDRKLVSKSIVFKSEISRDDVFKCYIDAGEAPKDIPEEYLRYGFDNGFEKAIKKIDKDMLLKDGYPEVFVDYLIKHGEPEQIAKAHALISIEGLSVDLRTQLIFQEKPKFILEGVNDRRASFISDPWRP